MCHLAACFGSEEGLKSNRRKRTTASKDTDCCTIYWRNKEKQEGGEGIEVRGCNKTLEVAKTRERGGGERKGEFS